MWAVGINITSSILLATPQAEGGYGFGPKAIGYLYFTPLVAVSLGEVFGHFFNDYVANRYIKEVPGYLRARSPPKDELYRRILHDIRSHHRW